MLVLEICLQIPQGPGFLHLISQSHLDIVLMLLVQEGDICVPCYRLEKGQTGQRFSANYREKLTTTIIVRDFNIPLSKSEKTTKSIFISVNKYIFKNLNIKVYQARLKDIYVTLKPTIEECSFLRT